MAGGSAGLYEQWFVDCDLSLCDSGSELHACRFWLWPEGFTKRGLDDLNLADASTDIDIDADIDIDKDKDIDTDMDTNV